MATLLESIYSVKFNLVYKRQWHTLANRKLCNFIEINVLVPIQHDLKMQSGIILHTEFS